MRFVRALNTPPESLDIDALQEAVSRPEIELVVVFGSYARADAGELSDLDIAVRFERDIQGSRKRQLLDELVVDVQDATAFEAVDLVDLDSVGPELGYEALARGVLVYGDREAALDLEAELMLKALDLQPLKRRWRAALDKRLREGTFGRP